MARPGRINRCEADNGKVVISYKKFLGVGEREKNPDQGADNWQGQKDEREGKGAGREESRRMTFSLGRLCRE